MSKLNFPTGITYEIKYVTGADYLDEDTKLSTLEYLYGYTQNSVIKLTVDTEENTNFQRMFYDANATGLVGDLNTSNCTTMSYIFNNSYFLEIPPIDTSNLTNFDNIFTSSRLYKIPLMDFGRATTVNTLFGYSQMQYLRYIEGFKDLKKSITSYFLDFVPNASVESLMNVINNLYDWSQGPADGKYVWEDGTSYSYGTTHTLKFGTTNLDKLTDEQKAVAINKGWTLT